MRHAMQARRVAGLQGLAQIVGVFRQQSVQQLERFAPRHGIAIRAFNAEPGVQQGGSYGPIRAAAMH